MHPHLLEIGNFSLTTYGVLAALGLIVGLILNVRLARAAGVDEDRAWNLGLISILAGIAGAKLLLVINSWDFYSAHPRELWRSNLLQAGGVWYGGFIAAVLAGMAYATWQKMPILCTWDAFTPGIALGHAIGRLGCFAAGCCYGKPTNMSWGVVFTDPAAGVTGTPLNVRLHPTQIYEFAAEFFIFLVLMAIIRGNRRSGGGSLRPNVGAFPGQIVGTYVFLYGIARFFLEFLRDDPERGSVFGGLMSGTQLISIFLVILGGALWMRRSPARQPASA